MNSRPNAGTALKPATEAAIVSMPNISVAKPSRIIPVSLRLLFFAVMKKMMPTKARIGVNAEGFRRLTKKVWLSMPARLRIQAVTVVPMLAPMMTLTACRRVMSPELTKPTTMTVVAEELCMIAVTPMPVRRPANLFVVSRPSSCFKPFPARRSNA